MYNNPRRQGGAILVLSVLFLVVLLAAAALVVDVGRLYVLRTQMQNAADTAAMAAAAELNGQLGARERAIKAATQMLSHKGPFSSSNDKDLLNHLKNYYDPADPDNSAIVFYSWIGAEYDLETPPPCDTSMTTDGKCLATEDSDAYYVKVVLDPLITTAEVDDFGIDFYFAPSMAIFFGGDPVLQGTTKVSAVAGAGGPVFCEYPPMFMCAYEEGPPTDSGTYPGLDVGDQVKLKDRAANTPWGPGNVGFLQVDEDIEIPLDDNSGTILEKNNDAIAASLGNEFLRRSCSPAIVSTQTGVDTQKTRKAFNTRFGIYESYDKAKNAFPPAPNTVDYPLDDTFTVESSSYDVDAFKGNGWTSSVTDCLVGGPLAPDCGGYTRPETFSRDDYIQYNHGDPGSIPPLADNSRYSLYEWESSSTLNSPSLDTGTLTNIDDRNASSQEDCSTRSTGKPGSQHCWLHNGTPLDGNPNLGTLDRRVLYVAVIKCSQFNITGNTPDINLNQQGDFPFHRFFLTQHAQAPSDAEFFAEYLGPVSDEKEIQRIRHTIIQLYE